MEKKDFESNLAELRRVMDKINANAFYKAMPSDTFIFADTEMADKIMEDAKRIMRNSAELRRVWSARL